MKFWTIIGIVFLSDHSLAECIWRINKDLPFKDPLIYQTGTRNKPRLLVPLSDQGIRLNASQTVKLACPGSGNYVKRLGREDADVTCVDGNNILADGLATTLKDLECHKALGGDVRRTNKSCLGRNGTLLEIGYQTSSGWLQLFDVCYDYARSIPLYSHHTIYGKSIAGAFIGNDRPGFKTTGLPSNVSMNSAYTKASQATRFESSLGTFQKDIFISNSSYLSRGHLAPDADFILHSWQRSTYFYANVAPQWMSINAGNWKRLEASIRDAAKNKNQLLKIWTGTAGVLELKNQNYNNVKMYLGKNERIPIPKYIWKVVCSISKSCIAFVVSNNPLASESICNDICRQTNWFREGYDNVSKGNIICCEVKEFIRAVNAVPEIVVKNILNN